MSTAFADLVVVDVATLNAAPQIATFFGDLGARVVKVESPAGDPLRAIVDATGAALQWKLANRNKACVTLDATVPEGRAILDRLLARADLVVSSLSAERLVAWRLDPESLRRTHPRLIGVNLTTYGVTGPWRDRPGSGTLAEAAGGLAHLTGPADGPPTLAPVGLGDHLGVLHGIIAALTGLLARSDGARSFDVAMTDGVLALLGQRVAQVVRSGEDPGRRGNRFPTMAPRNAYRASDGRWIALTAGTNDLVKRLFAAIDRPELAADPRFTTNRKRLDNVDALDDAIGAWVAGRTAEDAVRALLAARVSAAVIDDVRGVLANPHFAARGDLVTIDDPDVGPVTTAAPAPRELAEIRHLGRAPGADNEAIYCDWLGLDPADVSALRARGVL